MIPEDKNIDYSLYKERSLGGRYVTTDHISDLLEKHSINFDVRILGKSVLGEDIHFIKMGSGGKRILMWSQMHGNESTTTKSVFDLLNLLSDSDNRQAQRLLKECTIGIIPILSPDGARAYTRFNANQVDLNRDAQRLSQPESIILRTCFEEFRPNFCFNLHGQRTIFSAGNSNKSAMISFLAPAEDENRSITQTRKMAVDVIVEMNNHLQNKIPGHIGIYDDSFNINCVGDTFQALGVPTILFEAGHVPNDYRRELVREFIFESLYTGLCKIAFAEIVGAEEKAYFAIPQNQKLFYDIVIRNAKLKSDDTYYVKDIAVQYVEKLVQNQVIFVPVIERIAKLESFHGHKEILADEQLVSLDDDKVINEGVEIDFVYINHKRHGLNIEIK